MATKFTPIAPAEPIVAWQAAGSRRRLGMDALDLFYVHWKNPFVSARRVMQAMRPLVDKGLVRRAGVSNFTLAQWREAEAALRAPAVANQVQFSLAAPGPAEELVPYAEAAGRVVVAYSPLGQGVLAGRTDWSGAGFGRPQARLARRRDGLDPMQVVIRRVAEAHGATPAQVALAWVISHPNTLAIPGARTIEQLEENAAAADLELTEEELVQLTVVSRAFAGGSRAGRPRAAGPGRQPGATSGGWPPAFQRFYGPVRGDSRRPTQPGVRWTADEPTWAGDQRRACPVTGP